MTANRPIIDKPRITIKVVFACFFNFLNVAVIKGVQQIPFITVNAKQSNSELDGCIGSTNNYRIDKISHFYSMNSVLSIRGSVFRQKQQKVRKANFNVDNINVR